MSSAATNENYSSFLEGIEAQAALEAGYARGAERSLVTALLFDGVQSYINYICASSAHKKRRFIEAHHWIHGENGDYIFSFDNVCEALGFQPEFLRSGLEKFAKSLKGDPRQIRRNF